MAGYILYVKAGTHASSAYPLLASGVYYALDTVVRAGSYAFWKCTTAGTTTSATLTASSSDPTALITNGTSVWQMVSGEDGRVANTWDIAAENTVVAAPIGSSQPYGYPKAGKQYSSTGEASLFYFDKTAAVTPPASGSLYSQFVNVAEVASYYGLGQIATPLLPADRLWLVSAASGTYPAVYSKGAVMTVSNSSYTLGLGVLGFKGFAINCNSSIMYWSHAPLGSSTIYGNCRLISDNLFDDCDITLAHTPSGALIPTWVIGLENPAVSYPAAHNILARGGCLNYSEFLDCNIYLNHNQARIVTLCTVMFRGCTFSSNHGYMPSGGFLGLSRYAGQQSIGGASSANYGGNANDITVSFIACSFITPMECIIDYRVLGRALVLFDGCSFPPGFSMDTCLKNIPATVIAHLRVEFEGCGTTGNIDTSSHVFVTPRLKGIKTRATYRSAANTDRGGYGYAYYLTSGLGLEEYYYPEEIIKLTAEVPEGLVVVSLYVAVPADQLLTDRQLFAHFIFPDTGGSNFTNSPEYQSTESTANFYTTKPATPRDSATVLPVVVSAWSGLPPGWVVQKVSVIGRSPADGRVMCIPWISKNKASMYICPTLDVRSV